MATNDRALTDFINTSYVVGHEQASSLLFQCVLPIQWVLIIFWSGYKVQYAYKRDFAID
jgi:hypothetical protein